MSTTGAAPTITFSGLGSGINTTSIIQEMTAYASQPITQEQNLVAGYQSTLALWQIFNNTLGTVQTTAQSLTSPATFLATTSNSSNTGVASITSQAGAQIGSHSLTVNNLAQAQKVVGQSYSTSTDSLGESGTFLVNGKTVTVNPGDTLADIAKNINGANAGATAAVVNFGSNDYRLTITSNQTGKQNALSLVNGTSNGANPVLQDLGILSNSGTLAIRQALTLPSGNAAAGSLALNSASATVASALGSTNAPSGSFTINGTSVSANLATDSLNTIASKINSAGISGITAQVVTLPDANGAITVSSPQQLQIVSNSSTAPTFTDPNNVLQALGVVQSSEGNVIAQAKDASFTFDNLNLTRPSNTVNDLISGASITLQNTGTTSLTVSQNTNTIVSSVQSFVAAYNTAQDFITQQNAFTPPTGKTGTAVQTSSLFGDSTLTQIQSQLSSALTAVSNGVSLQSLGITIGSNNDLTVNTTALTNELQTNPTAVQNLFGLSGSATNGQVSFISAGSSTQSSAGAGYAVNITQAATQASATGQAHTAGAASSQAETLTFSGALFGKPVSLTLAAGNTLAQTVSQINNDSSVNGSIYASINSATNSLVLSSVAFGTGNGFSVSSSLAASGTNSGLGSVSATDGQNVAGTINGEAATGAGQVLTGNTGNKTTAGLAINVAATSAGSYGSVSVSHGVADRLNTILSSILDPTTGAVIGAENAVNSEITNANNQITQVQATVTEYTNMLTQEFSTMETQVSALQQQGAAFDASAGITSTSSSGSSTSGTSSSSSSSG